MSPQPAAAPKADSVVERQIARAKALYRDYVKVQKQIDANRRYLRLMADNDELTDAQEDWLDAFYRQKAQGERSSEAELAETRRVKQEALDEADGDE